METEIEEHGHNERHETGPKGKIQAARKWLGCFLRSNLLVLLMLLGVVLGVTIGAGLSKLDPKLSNKQIVYLRFPGDLFIQLMKMMIIPIVVSNLVTSMAEMDIRSSGKIGLRALVYFLCTLTLASALGMIIVVTIRPGERGGSKSDTESHSYDISSNPVNAIMDLLRNMVPDNLMEVYFLSIKTEEVGKEARNIKDGLLAVNISSSSLTGTFGNLSETTNLDQKVDVEDISLLIKKVPGTNMIGMVTSSIMFGCAISTVGMEARPLLKLFSALQAVSFKLISICIWTSPVGIAFLLAANLAHIGDPSQTFQDLAMFSITILSGALLHVLVTLPVIYFIFVRKNPFKFLQGIIPAAIFAFGSDSSAATLPLTIRCLQEKNGVDRRVTKLVASLGATINMDGACIFYSVMPVYVAQLNSIPLSAGDYLTICCIGISIAVGAAAVPGVGVVYMLMMLTAMDLPTDAVSTILAVDWFLIRIRTSVNVIGDGFGAGIVEQLSRLDLQRIKPPSEAQKTSKPSPSELEDDSVELMTRI